MSFQLIIHGKEKNGKSVEIDEVGVVFLLGEYILLIQVRLGKLFGLILIFITFTLCFVLILLYWLLGEGERHWLRLLLHHVRGAKGFEDLRTRDNIVYNSFKEAAIARGLLEDDREIISCLQESSSIRTGRALRELFALILAINTPAAPAQVWEQFLVPFTEDMLHEKRQVNKLYYDFELKSLFCEFKLVSSFDLMYMTM